MERYYEISEDREIQETHSKTQDIPQGWQPSPETITIMQGETEQLDNKPLKDISPDSEYRHSLDKETLAEREPGSPSKPSGVGTPGDSSLADTSDDASKPTQNEAPEEDPRFLDEIKKRDEEYNLHRQSELRQYLRNLENE